ncbi:ornithine carbamoyltransferase [Halomonas cerina]|uniref:Ornithine carbamoyltransferase n=1 Tax=Halomonas cerina TaxID=447424 RepID=A0A839VHW1_9GAMM|nr:hypothetical protein [Halomonas cerina]MBB3192184.1 ornithine carbamoyltransferase [Halomonas cerina]
MASDLRQLLGKSHALREEIIAFVEIDQEVNIAIVVFLPSSDGTEYSYTMGTMGLGCAYDGVTLFMQLIE